MAEYRHYRLDGSGGISSADWLQANGDDDAIRQVRGRKLRFASEIWDRERLVARIEASRPE